MDTNLLKELLEKYQVKNPQEDIESLLEFIDANDNPYTRENLSGHITCSSWIIDEAKEEVLLIHHKKYDKWLQPGGHMELGETVYESALREGSEETGLGNIDLINNEVFDIDIHKIPENKKKGEPEHYHFDLRFATVVKNKEITLNQEECNDINWLPISEIESYTNDTSILRMASKTNKLEVKQKLNKRTKLRR